MNQEQAKQTDPALRLAIRALADAEGKLRDAAAQAAGNGEYDALAVITRWAKTVRSLATESNGSANSPILSPTVAAPISTGIKPVGVSKLKAGTPVFARDSDVLVKTARSKKSKNEYEHRAPVDVVLTVAECLSDWRPNRKLLTGDQLLDSYAKKKGSVVSYQVYAVLGWITQTGLVRRHGRSGYSVPHPNTIVGDVQKAWESLKNGQHE